VYFFILYFLAMARCLALHHSLRRVLRDEMKGNEMNISRSDYIRLDGKEASSNGRYRICSSVQRQADEREDTTRHDKTANTAS